MKTTRKLLAMVLAVMMVMSLATTAFAAEGDIYEIYQIFTGDYSEGKLSNVKWGKNGIEAENTPVDDSIIAELADVNNAATDKEKLAVIEKYVDLSSAPFETGSTTSYELTNGYYLVKNVDGTQDGENQFYTMYVVEVVNGTLEFKPKGSVPTVEKTVDKDDVSIGETVTYTLTATMPENIADYDTYKVIFHDSLSDGLSYQSISSVVVGNTALTEGQYTVNHVDGELTITIEDVTVYNVTKDSTVVVTYTAKLNANAVIGAEGNPNTVYLEYSNNPNSDGEGDTGKTPPKEEEVFTWSMNVTKKDGNGAALAGAGFTLYDADGNEIKLTQVENTTTYKVDPNGAITQVITDASGKFTIEGLKSATYTLKETKTPDGYNTAADQTVTINKNTAEVEVINYAGSTLPETGGMGTTLFYVFGAIMMVGAAVLLVTKKRMASAE